MGIDFLELAGLGAGWEDDNYYSRHASFMSNQPFNCQRRSLMKGVRFEGDRLEELPLRKRHTSIDSDSGTRVEFGRKLGDAHRRPSNTASPSKKRKSLPFCALTLPYEASSDRSSSAIRRSPRAMASSTRPTNPPLPRPLLPPASIKPGSRSTIRPK